MSFTLLSDVAKLPRDLSMPAPQFKASASSLISQARRDLDCFVISHRGKNFLADDFAGLAQEVDFVHAHEIAPRFALHDWTVPKQGFVNMNDAAHFVVATPAL